MLKQKFMSVIALDGLLMRQMKLYALQVLSAWTIAMPVCISLSSGLK
jgi:hypothetical protein